MDGKRDDGNLVMRSSWRATASLYKGFLADRLSFLLQGDDLFNLTRQEFENYSGKARITNVKNKLRWQSVSLTVQYKFNPRKSKYKGTGAGAGQRNRL
ncbi:MAG: outer membrane beta-barrel family protein [Mediterranea sp.]|jgi:hypothetical protein|nr:outer membrane beta-barrel family protein [Mediterranea sp.]